MNFYDMLHPKKTVLAGPRVKSFTVIIKSTIIVALVISAAGRYDPVVLPNGSDLCTQLDDATLPNGSDLDTQLDVATLPNGSDLCTQLVDATSDDATDLDNQPDDATSDDATDLETQPDDATSDDATDLDNQPDDATLANGSDLDTQLDVATTTTTTTTTRTDIVDYDTAVTCEVLIGDQYYDAVCFSDDASKNYEMNSSSLEQINIQCFGPGEYGDGVIVGDFDFGPDKGVCVVYSTNYYGSEDDSDSTEDEETTKIALLAGLVCAVLLFVIIVVLCCRCCCRRERKTTQVVRMGVPSQSQGGEFAGVQFVNQEGQVVPADRVQMRAGNV